MPEPTKCGACSSWEKQDDQDPASGLCRQMPIKGTFMMMFADDECLKERGEKDETLITVCDKCLQASCWQGIFMCDEARNAGITQKTIGELRKLGRENECYWLTDNQLANQ